MRGCLIARRLGGDKGEVRLSSAIDLKARLVDVLQRLPSIRKGLNWIKMRLHKPLVSST